MAVGGNKSRCRKFIPGGRGGNTPGGIGFALTFLCMGNSVYWPPLFEIQFQNIIPQIRYVERSAILGKEHAGQQSRHRAVHPGRN